MTSITTLPTEILSQILSPRLLPESDIKSCALVCKDFNTIATANLYRDIYFDLPNFAYTEDARVERCKKLHSIQLLLTQLAVNDGLADHVHSLVLHGFSNDVRDAFTRARRFETGFLFRNRLVSDVQLSIPAPLTFSQLTAKMSQLKVLNLDVGFTALLLQDSVVLPNLEVAVLWSLNARFPYVQFLMSQPRISEIRFNHGMFKTNMTAPSHSSTATRIVLNSQRGFLTAVPQLVAMSQSLRSLKWCLYYNHYSRGDRRRASSICAAARESVNLALDKVSHSLQEFVLTHCQNPFEQVPPHSDLGIILIPSLRLFECLRELKVEASMLLGIRRCPSRPNKFPAQVRPGHELATLLPASLRMLHLEVEREQIDRDRKYFRDIIKGIVQQQNNRFLHLKHIVIEEINPDYRGSCLCNGGEAWGTCFSMSEDLLLKERIDVKKHWNLQDICAMVKECDAVGIQLTYVWRCGKLQGHTRAILGPGGSLRTTRPPYDWTKIGV